MKKLIIIILGPLILGPLGYFLGQMMAPEPVKEMAGEAGAEKPGQAVATNQEILYKMPLGKLTVQVMQPDTVLHIVIDMDIYIAGASEFGKMNGSSGRALLRDSAIRVLSDMAETTLWVDYGAEDNIDQLKIVEELVRKMHRTYGFIRTARFNSFNTTRTHRL